MSNNLYQLIMDSEVGKKLKTFQELVDKDTAESVKRMESLKPGKVGKSISIFLILFFTAVGISDIVMGYLGLATEITVWLGALNLFFAAMIAKMDSSRVDEIDSSIQEIETFSKYTKVSAELEVIKSLLVIHTEDKKSEDKKRPPSKKLAKDKTPEELEHQRKIRRESYLRCKARKTGK